MESRKSITKVFNVALLLYFLFNSTIRYFFDPEGDKRVLWDKIYEWSPSFAVAGALVILLISALIGAFIGKIFWNRFVADVFKVREISFDESLALVLIIAIVAA